ncbi:MULTISPECIES: peptidoglycan-binding protein [Spirulina sp. CCY15215]|uniref:peptidoglycan-binding domain-containing protein n=1 Tax=Spirulina sp. CCY15215 TaxID=2767591 RepID=UPI0019517D27|nr:peptidoglycan-binding protein [Spirulina major]
MIKQNSLLVLGITISIIGVSDGAIALTTQSDRLEYLYAQTNILRPGDRGEAVSELQKVLKAIGVFNGPISGVYGQQTELAIRRFQRDRGLIEDGIAGVQTRAAISAVARSQTGSSSPPPSPASPSSPPFTLGSQGDAVRQIQQRLQVLGYFPASPTGNYDETTQQAIMQFQRDRALTVDGIVGSQTIIALERSLSPQQIRALQQRLKTAGFYDGAIDGVWGEQTKEAIAAARGSFGLNVTDVTRENN